MAAAELNLALHPKQHFALSTTATEVLYGGAAGGGKSHLMRVAAVLWCAMVPGLQVYLFRRIREDLEKNHLEGPKGFRMLLAPWVVAGFCVIVEGEIRFWNGSRIWLCHCKDEKDRFKYLGAEIHVLIIDELTTFTEVIYRFLRGRVRAVGLNLPDELKGKFPRILVGSNPGGIGHHFVKASFIDGVVPLEIRAMNDDEGGMRRQFIPALLDDNPSMTDDDPSYRAKLKGLGSPALVKAMEDGDWNVVAGAYFSEWSTDKHVIEPFTVPAHWLRFTSLDWGSAKPFSVGWWAISDGSLLPGDRQYPTGAMIRYREWYGASAPNVGLKLTAEDLAEGIIEREIVDKVAEKIDYRVADPACWKVDGGPSIAERMYAKRVLMRRADNSRVTGWDQLRGRLLGDDDPMLYVFKNCVHFIRTFPVLQHDSKRAEDLDTDGEDHCFAAGTLVETECGPVTIESLPANGVVWSVDGLRPYHGARMMQRDAKVVKLTFDTGREVICTPDHLFLTQDGWVPSIDLLDKCRYVLMSNMGASQCGLRSFRRPSKSLMVSAITSAVSISSIAVCGFIAAFGKLCAGRFLTDGTSIIAMKTVATTKLRTSIASPLLSICKLMGLLAGSVRESICQRHAPPPLNGMAQMLAWSGMDGITGELLRNYTPPSGSPANSAARHLTGSVVVDPGFVATPVRQRGVGRQGSTMKPASVASVAWASKVTAIRKNLRALWNALARHRQPRVATCLKIEPAAHADVYCLTVPGTAAFVIEGGLITHNCADETRYAAMSRPWTRKSPTPGEISGIQTMTMQQVWQKAAPKTNRDARI